MAKKSQELNAALAASIKAQPVSIVEAAIAELRAAGLSDDADALGEVLAAREQELAEARAAKEREEAAARERAIAAARKEFDAKAAAYVELRDDALAALEAYVDRAEPGMAAYREMVFAADNLDRLTGNAVERAETAQAIFNRSDAFRKIQHNAFSSQPL
jgi:hypothetical protein